MSSVINKWEDQATLQPFNIPHNILELREFPPLRVAQPSFNLEVTSLKKVCGD